MNQTNPNDAAFPTETGRGWHHGMTLRDYFAAKALQGMVSVVQIQDGLGRKTITMENVANASYEWADAMLQARQK